MQEAAGCLGVDSVPRYVNTKQMNELDVDDIIPKSNKARIFITMRCKVNTGLVFSDPSNYAGHPKWLAKSVGRRNGFNSMEQIQESLGITLRQTIGRGHRRCHGGGWFFSGSHITHSTMP